MPTHYVRSELYNAGNTEDGYPYHAEIYIIIREFENGTRFAFNESFKGAEAWNDGEGGCGFSDVREDALKAAEARLVEVTDSTDDCWGQIDSAYC